MTPEQLYAVIGSNVVAIAVVSGIVGTFFLRTVSRLDRRAFQAGMETFRNEMQRLAERQSHLEGAASD